MSKLLIPCPFCGDTDIRITQHMFPPLMWYVWCPKHSDIGMKNENVFKAKDAWNSRVYPPEVQEVLTAAKRYANYEPQGFDDFLNIAELSADLIAAVRVLKESKEKDER